MMRTLAAAAMVLLAGLACADQPSMRFDNAFWFTGERFVAATVFVEDGRLRFAKSKKDARAPAQQVVDLAGKHVAPPFCEAHNHNLGLADDSDNERFIYRYLHDGVFYVKVLSNLPRESAAVWHTYNRPESVDAVFANGGVTGLSRTGAHRQGRRGGGGAAWHCCRNDRRPDQSLQGARAGTLRQES